MNRLTKTYEDGTFGVANDLPCGENSYDFKNLLIKKLGEYEELNFTPKQISKMYDCLLNTAPLIRRFTNETFDLSFNDKELLSDANSWLLGFDIGYNK